MALFRPASRSLLCKAQSVRSISTKSDGFGSFHSGNFHELLQTDDLDKQLYDELRHCGSAQMPWVKLTAPGDDKTSIHQRIAALELGSDELRQEFMIDFDNWTFVNHGAFGGTLACVQHAAQRWRNYQESQPLRFFDRHLLPALAWNTQQMARWMGCKSTELALVPNATTGLNAAIASLSQGQRPSKALYLSLAYGSVKIMLQEYTEQPSLQVDITLPLSNSNGIVQAVSAVLEQHTDITLAVFDHVTSNTGLTLPIAELIAVCQNQPRTIPVVIDGAHGLWQHELNMDQWQPAAYVTNTHKWFGSAKACGLLYMPSANQDGTFPSVISHGYRHDFNSRFVWDGCRDYSAALTLGVAMEFWEALGVERARAYSQGLLKSVAKEWQERFDVELATPLDMHHQMLLVPLPSWLQPARELSGQDAPHLQDWLYQQGIEVPVKRLQGRLFLRLSAHVYNRRSDYERVMAVLARGPETCNLFV
jgi:selenocysteine lyase/cysteine desulfurase